MQDFASATKVVHLLPGIMRSTSKEIPTSGPTSRADASRTLTSNVRVASGDYIDIRIQGHIFMHTRPRISTRTPRSQNFIVLRLNSYFVQQQQTNNVNTKYLISKQIVYPYSIPNERSSSTTYSCPTNGKSGIPYQSNHGIQSVPPQREVGFQGNLAIGSLNVSHHCDYGQWSNVHGWNVTECTIHIQAGSRYQP